MNSITRKIVMAMFFLFFATSGYSFEPPKQFKQMRELMKSQIDRMFSDDFFNDSSFGGFHDFSDEGISILEKDDADFQYYTISGKGIHPEDLDININKGRVTIKIQKKVEEQNDEEGEHNHSLSSLSFVQSFGIPKNLDESGVEIVQDDGKMVLKFPKLRLKGGSQNRSDNVI